MATIKVRQNGSLLVEGDDVTLIDWNGNEYTLPKRPFGRVNRSRRLSKRGAAKIWRDR